jgi:hypothetical protein
LREQIAELSKLDLSQEQLEYLQAMTSSNDQAQQSEGVGAAEQSNGELTETVE